MAYWRYCVAIVNDRLRCWGSDDASFLIAHRGDVEPESYPTARSPRWFSDCCWQGTRAPPACRQRTPGTAQPPPELAGDLQRHLEIPGAVEEALRFSTSIVYWRRRTRAVTGLQGMTIPANANVLLALGAANHDAELFPKPDRFDIGRPNASEHLSFGSGTHACIGAPSARLELVVLLEEIVRRYPALALVENQPIDYIRTIAFRGPKRLMARLGD